MVSFIHQKSPINNLDLANPPYSPLLVVSCNTPGEQWGLWHKKHYLYPVGSVTTSNVDICGEEDGKFLLSHRLCSLPVCPLDLLNRLLQQQKTTLTTCNIIQKKVFWPQGIARNTHHVPEGGACALASGVVLQNGRIVDQLSNIVTEITEEEPHEKYYLNSQQSNSHKN